jgi:hypothetical protein
VKNFQLVASEESDQELVIRSAASSAGTGGGGGGSAGVVCQFGKVGGAGPAAPQGRPRPANQPDSRGCMAGRHAVSRLLVAAWPASAGLVQAGRHPGLRC